MTTEYIINYLKKTFDYGSDIAQALKELQDVDTNLWKPTLQQNDDRDDPTKTATLNKQYEMEFQADYDAYRKKILAYENNKTKSYALLWERCTKAMKNKIESRTNFESKVENNPIELLKAIKEHALNYQENRYDMSIILDAHVTLLGTKQKEDESLQDYTKRFRVAKDVFESHMGGPMILTKIVEAMDGYNETDSKSQEKFRNEAYQRFIAFLYMSNSDKSKYGSLLTGLHTQQSLNNDQYPRTITDANNVLSNHRFDNVKFNKSRQKDGDKDRNEQVKSKPKEEQDITLSFAQLEGKCYCCGKLGHKSPQCRFNKRPKSEWAIHKAEQSHLQSSETPVKTIVENEPKINENNTVNTGWAGTHIQFYQASDMRNWILLDNQSSTTIFCNPEMVHNIRNTDDTLSLTTNAGVLTTNKKADLPGWGEVWFSTEAVTNIFSMAHMVDRHPVTYDATKEDAFIVHLPHKQVKFCCNPNGLYIFKPHHH